MKTILRLLFLANLVALTCNSVAFAAQADDEAAHNALRDLKTTYENAVNSGNLTPLQGLFTPDTSGVMLLGKDVKTYADLEQYWASIRDLIGPGGSYHVTLNPERSLVMGDVALARGTTDEIVKTGIGQEFHFNSEYTVVFRLIDGQWKVLRIHASMDPVTNVFTAAFLDKAKLYYGIGGIVVGIVLGLIVDRLLKKRSATA